MDIQTLIQLRGHALEQYAQVHADLEGLRAGKKALKKRACALLQDLRQLTQQINQAAEAQEQTEKAKAEKPACTVTHDVMFADPPKNSFEAF